VDEPARRRDAERLAVRRPLAITLAALLVAACTMTTRPPAAGGITSPGEADGGTLDADVGDAESEGDAAADPTDEADTTADGSGPCPPNMVLAGDDHRFCIDKYEASLVEASGDGSERPYPHWLPVDGHSVRAVSRPGVFPQGYISEVQADDACAASSKRLCTYDEWKSACRGPTNTTFPYGDERRAGLCHDAGKSAVGAVFGARAMTDPVARAPASPAQKPAASGKTPNRPAQALKGRAAQTTHARAAPRATATKGKGPAPKRGPAKASARPASVTPSVWAQLNDPRLGQVDGSLSRTGSHEACVSGYGAVDMVGNLHEWVKTDATKTHGLFAGGYYLDTSINGDGCNYKTTAHAHDYHDYSTGFRCCADPTSE
jgi:hypothetical protein